MKIAAVSEDGVNLSQHFGRAPLYVVFTVDKGTVVDKETRPKTGHHTFAASEHPASGPSERHGYDPASQARHKSMAGTITDCQVLLTGGMGWGAYEGLRSYGIEPILTDIERIDEAVQLYLDGKLINLMDRLH